MHLNRHSAFRSNIDRRRWKRWVSRERTAETVSKTCTLLDQVSGIGSLSSNMIFDLQIKPPKKYITRKTTKTRERWEWYRFFGVIQGANSPGERQVTSGPVTSSLLGVHELPGLSLRHEVPYVFQRPSFHHFIVSSLGTSTCPNVWNRWHRLLCMMHGPQTGFTLIILNYKVHIGSIGSYLWQFAWKCDILQVLWCFGVQRFPLWGIQGILFAVHRWSHHFLFGLGFPVKVWNDSQKLLLRFLSWFKNLFETRGTRDSCKAPEPTRRNERWLALCCIVTWWFWWMGSPLVFFWDDGNAWVT